MVGEGEREKRERRRQIWSDGDRFTAFSGFYELEHKEIKVWIKICARDGEHKPRPPG